MSSERADDVAISCEGLGKAYRVYDHPRQRMLELLGLRDPARAPMRWALRGVGLDVRRGECVGIVGRNGAGKSTLLQLIAGTSRASEGGVRVRGRVAALLELTSGFNPELTGRENIGLRASVLGLDSRTIREREGSIVGFAGLGSQIDEPVRTYSTGMQARLAFAVAAHVDADVLIVDETLAVGDGMFVQKCMRWIRSFRERGTLLFVSHATTLVVDLCDRAVWLDGGVVRMDGVAKEVVRAYDEATHRDAVGDPSVHAGRGLGGAVVGPTASDRADADTDADGVTDGVTDARAGVIEGSGLRARIEQMRLDPRAAWWGRGGAMIESVRLLDGRGRATGSIGSGGVVTIEMVGTTSERLEHPVMGYVVRDARGLVLFSDNSWLAFDERGPGAIGAGRRFVARFVVRFPFLPAGEYALGAAVADGRPGRFVQHHRVDDAMLFRVPTSHLVEGLVGVPMLGCAIEDAGVAEDAARDAGGVRA